MSVTGINQNGGVSTWSQIAPWQQNTQATASASTGQPKDAFKSDFAALFSAVQSGDMTSAQQALTQLQSDQQAVYGPASPGSSASTTSSTTSSGSPVQNDLQALISAVKAGDPAAAQKALSTLQGDLKALGGGHHHHHHGGGGAPAPATSATDPLATDSTSTDLASSATANGTVSGGAVSG